MTTLLSTKANKIVSYSDYLKEKFPEKHDHYGFDQFFSFNPEKGIIKDWNTARNIFVTEDFIIGLIEGLQEEVGDASSVIMYNIGYEWGLKDCEFFYKWFRKEYDMKLQEANHQFVLEAWWWPFISQGWGNWEVDFSGQQNGFIFVNIFDSAVARTLGDVGKPVCHIYAGLFAGFFSELLKKSLNCIEIQCYSMGETYCKFLLGKKDKIDAATFWKNEGANANDIEKKLQNGEFLK